MMPDPALIAAVIIALASVTGLARLWLWHSRAPEAERSGLRLAGLAALGVASAVLLYLTLFPPPLAQAPGTMIVATRGAKAIAAQAGDRVIALPEANVSEANVPGAERVPDLATALRTHPETTRLMVVGEGLSARDLPATAGLALAFTPAPLPRGIVRLDLPARAAPGASFGVGVSVNGVKAARVELLDPSGTVVDTQISDAAGQVQLSGVAKAAGPADFAVRVRDGAGQVVETADAPVWVDDTLAARVRVVAGAPGPEIKYLRRWAADAGLNLQAEARLGGGVEAGDAPPPLSAATLAQTDLLVIDERGWEGLGEGGRAAVIGAVRGGMGLWLRPTALPSEAVRGQWAALGIRLTGGNGDPVTAELRPEATPDPDQPAKPVKVTRLDLRPEAVAGGGGVAFLSDARGQVLGLWRAEGRGRVGVWTVVDSFALTLSGETSTYDGLWSSGVSVLARRAPRLLPNVALPVRVNERVSLCGLTGEAEVLDPAGGSVRVQPDPATGDTRCAAVWPTRAGWHIVRLAHADSVADGVADTVAFFVSDAQALPGMRALMAREATLARVTPQAKAVIKAQAAGRRGSPWPWFAGWLLISALLWAVERRKAKI